MSSTEQQYADPGKRGETAFATLDRIGGMKRGTGGVVCMADHLLPPGETAFIVPVAYL